jgi:hypothetical protein
LFSRNEVLSHVRCHDLGRAALVIDVHGRNYPLVDLLMAQSYAVPADMRRAE